MLSKYRVGKRLLSIACVVSLFSTALPLCVAAKETSRPPSDTLPDATVDEPQIIGEIESRRDEHTKVFLMSDGQYMAALYNDSVHYQDENGEWQDIDNTLSDNGQELETCSGPVKVKLSNKLKSGKTVTYKSDTHTLKWGFEGARKVKGVVDAPESKSGNARWLQLDAISSRVVYPDAYRAVDVEYIVSSFQIKENLILKDKTAPTRFIASYTIKGMTAVQKDARTIELFDIEDSERKTPQFTLSAPEMLDATGAWSDSLTLTIIEQDKKELRVELNADPEWLQEEERAYPVVLDPVLVSTQRENVIEDTFTCTNGDSYPNLDNYGSLIVGRETSAYGQCRMLVNFTEMPKLNKGDMVVAAKLNMVQMLNYMSPANTTMQINAHAVTKEWHENGNSQTGVTWDRMAGAYDPTVLDYAVVTNSTSAHWDTWDVSKTVKEWYDGTRPQYGFMLKRHMDDEFYPAGRTGYVASENGPLNGAFPCLQVYFINNKGLEDYWGYYTQSIGDAGTSYVNDYTGNLVVNFPLLNTTGTRMPISLSLIYNGYQAQTPFKDNQRGLTWGLGMMCNISQRIQLIEERNGTNAEEKAKYKALAEIGYKYVFLDEDGTEHYFLEKDGKLIDEDGLNLEITVHTSSEEERFIMHYKDGTRKAFNTGGYLTRIYDTNGNAVVLTYNGTYLTKITDGAGRDIIITADGSHRVSRITAPDGRYVELTYLPTGVVSHIRGLDGRSSQIQYDSGAKITAVYNPDGSGVQYTYHPDVNVTKYGQMVGSRVKSVSEVGTDFTKGNKIEFTYNVDNTTTVTYSGMRNGVAYTDTETYIFDNLGRTINTVYADGSASSVTYTSKPNLSSIVPNGQENRVTSSASSQGHVDNLLLNSSAEKGMEGWSGTLETGSTGEVVATSEESYLGENSFKIIYPGGGTSSINLTQTITTVEPDTVYTLSGYMKLKDFYKTLSYNGCGIYYGVKFPNSSVYGESASKLITNTSPITTDWEYFSFTFTTPSDVETMIIRVSSILCKGDMYFDCLQLEKGATANNYNLLEDSRFHYGSLLMKPTKWSYYNLGGMDYLLAYPGGGENDETFRMHFKGVASSDTPESYSPVKYIYQTVPIYKPAKECAFIVACEAEGYSVPRIGEDGREFGIRLDFEYTDGTKESKTINFNADAYKQYLIAPVLPSKVNREKTLESVSYCILYCNNCNDMYFTKPMLLMDETGSSYTYDAEGNMETAEQHAQNNSRYEFTDANELAVSTNRNNESYQYIYNPNNEHRLTAAYSKQTDLGLTFTYDSYGNVIGTKMGKIIPSADKSSASLDTTQPYMESSATYTANGNYLASSTDARGKVTTQTVDNLTGLLQQQIMPNGAQYNYTYDTLKRLAGIEFVAPEGSVLGDHNITYSYHNYNNWLDSIQINDGMEYVMSYDAFGKVTSNKIRNGTGLLTLSTNSYDAQNGALTQMQYGNGDSIGYTYDNRGRLSTLAKNGVSRYTYTYDARGNLARVTDLLTAGNTRTYRYDIGNRMTGWSMDNGAQAAYSYDDMNRLTKTAYTIDGETRTAQYAYGQDGRLDVPSTLLDGSSIQYTYDVLGRITESNYDVITGTHIYEMLPGNKTTPMVSQIRFAKTDSDSTYFEESYTYDDNANILQVRTTSAGLSAQYAYDELGQLVSAQGGLSGLSTYTYDGNGNILSRTTSSKTINYSYGHDIWKDLLTSYDGQTITYDAIGNPLTYRDGMSFTWNGRQLQSVTKNGVTTTYAYDENGIRIRKNDSDIIVDGSRVIYMDGMWFMYDAAGEVIGFIKDGISYYYVKNIQGDIVKIIDENGNLKGEYFYDEWGKSTGILYGNEISENNPFRYRGYFYDNETGLYYLNSRYYDPVTGRFINADGYLSTGQGLLGHNMFAYCGNNPVNRIDPSGEDYYNFFYHNVLGHGPYNKPDSLSTPSLDSSRLSTGIPEIVPGMPKDDFAKAIYARALIDETHTQIPAAIMAGQACLESGYGTSAYALQKNNIFGFVGYEFDSIEEAIQSYENTLMKNSAYAHLFGMTVKEWAYNIGPAGYCTDEGYGETLWKVIQDNNFV